MKDCDWDSHQLYEKLIEPIREKSRELGYAIAVHGTLKRDIDLIACPWTPEAVPERELADALFALVEHIHGRAYWSWHLIERPVGKSGPFDLEGKLNKEAADANFAREYTLAGAPGSKPHGRLGWVINLGGGPYIDLSVMPRVAELTMGDAWKAFSHGTQKTFSEFSDGALPDAI